MVTKKKVVTPPAKALRIAFSMSISDWKIFGSGSCLTCVSHVDNHNCLCKFPPNAKLTIV